ncbi:MAG: hypothetical protein AB8I08_20935 [Sandaracinaceae bacterium]
MRTWILAACASAVLLFAPASSSACLNVVERDRVPEIRPTQMAEQQLSRGRVRRAVRVARRALAGVERRRRGDSRRRQLHPRLIRVLAVATVRLEGGVERPGWRTPMSMPAHERSANLRWALDRLYVTSRSTPVERAHYGEALAALGRHAAARDVLRALSRADLMPDAHAFAALARAEAALGNLTEAEQAWVGCRAVASRRQRSLCRGDGAS